ncbi:hypothetical protein [Actinomyces faecalis]|uniref:hypothetical protein n=1 Tax=Actinomyces faecalis TaxID=2722820 RepID=UPI0015565E38|nr:hypothetical protein [Actinomyces faecalis]
MKRRDLEKALRRIAKEHGLALTLKEGGNHAVATVGTWREPLPRHREIAEKLARKIIRRCQEAREES